MHEINKPKGCTVKVEWVGGQTDKYSPCSPPEVRDGILHFGIGWEQPTEIMGIPIKRLLWWSWKRDCTPPEGGKSRVTLPDEDAKKIWGVLSSEPGTKHIVSLQNPPFCMSLCSKVECPADRWVDPGVRDKECANCLNSAKRLSNAIMLGCV